MSLCADIRGGTLSSGGTLMTKTEELIEEAEAHGAEVIDWDFKSDRIKGMYCNGVIAVNKNLKTSAEQSAVIAEELGHHITAVGNIIDQSDVTNRKQEMRGRAWAYDRLIGLSGIVKAIDAGCQSKYEMAEYLEVAEDTLKDALFYYREKYGLCTRFDNHVIYFEPLRVIEISEIMDKKGR